MSTKYRVLQIGDRYYPQVKFKWWASWYYLKVEMAGIFPSAPFIERYMPKSVTMEKAMDIIQEHIKSSVKHKRVIHKWPITEKKLRG